MVAGKDIVSRVVVVAVSLAGDVAKIRVSGAKMLLVEMADVERRDPGSRDSGDVMYPAGVIW